jgi:hypothetical protein
MALAKYLEDITDRYFEDKAAMERLEATFAPGTYQAAPQVHTGWVRLALNGGPLPDRIALVEGEEPIFSIETDKAGAPFGIEFTAGPRAQLPEVHIADRKVHFTLQHDGFYVLKVSCGAYSKDYEIDVTRTLDLDHQDPIQQGYLYLQDRPDEWTRERLDALKRMMIPDNRPAGVPDSFCNGILDYHLALFHAESENEGVANLRFEDAYRNLRPFIAHSDVAHFICDYIRYLMNQFDGCDSGRSRGRFGGLRSFLRAPYVGSFDVHPEATPAPAGRYIEVLVKSIDQQLLDVVKSLRDPRPGSLEVSLDSLETRLRTGRHDAACRARLTLVLARGHRLLGSREVAARHYKQLLQSDTASTWHAESSQFISLRA